MAENKKSFILYTDYIKVFEHLSDREAGILVKHLFKYVNDMNPKLENKLLTVAFEPIKQQLKRDLKDWEAERRRLQEFGKKGGIKSGESRRKRSQRSQASKNEANEAVTVTDTVTVTVTERENTGPRDLQNSNLFRKPNIPTKEQVWEAINAAGGTREMAKSFWEKHQATGWFINGSPIVNYTALASRFVSNWNDNEKKETPNSSGPKLKII